MQTEQIEIRNRWDNKVQFTAEITCAPDATIGVKIGLAVAWARKNDADLSGANLRGADLRSFKADMWMTLAQNRSEVPALIDALKDGRVDGSQYTGECACLVGTIANSKAVDYDLLDHNSNNPAERWFMMIRKGDKPGDDTGGGFAAQKALEWAEEFQRLMA